MADVELTREEVEEKHYRKRTRTEAGSGEAKTAASEDQQSRTPGAKTESIGGLETSRGSEGSNMGTGSSACKGTVNPHEEDQNGDVPPRSLSTVTRLPFLPVFEDRPPFKTDRTLSERDSSLLKALTHHRTPFAVVESDTPDLKVIYASGGCVAGLNMPVESVEGTGFDGVLKKGLKASDQDVERLVSAIRAKQVNKTEQKSMLMRRTTLCLPFFQSLLALYPEFFNFRDYFLFRTFPSGIL